MASGLHDHAVQAESHLEKLATGLAQAGADQGTVQTVGQMADAVRKIVQALGKGQEQTGDLAPPPAEQAAPQRQSADSAIAATHQDMQAAAAARQP